MMYVYQLANVIYESVGTYMYIMNYYGDTSYHWYCINCTDTTVIGDTTKRRCINGKIIIDANYPSLLAHWF